MGQGRLLQDKRIFIIDDQPNNYIILKHVLTAHGAVIGYDRRAANIVDRLLTFAPIHLILLDLMLANNLSGFDLYEKIRAVPQLANVPTVAVSASDPSKAIPTAQQHGLVGFIAKPIDADLLPHQIVQVLEGQSVWLARH